MKARELLTVALMLALTCVSCEGENRDQMKALMDNAK